MKVERTTLKNPAGRTFTARIISADPPPDKETFRVIHARAKEHFDAATSPAPAKPEVK